MNSRRLMVKAFFILIFGGAAFALAEPVEGCNLETGSGCADVFCGWVGSSPDQGCSEGWVEFFCSHECMDWFWGACGSHPMCEDPEDYGESWAAFQCFNGGGQH